MAGEPFPFTEGLTIGDPLALVLGAAPIEAPGALPTPTLAAGLAASVAVVDKRVAAITHLPKRLSIGSLLADLSRTGSAGVGSKVVGPPRVSKLLRFAPDATHGITVSVRPLPSGRAVVPPARVSLCRRAPFARFPASGGYAIIPTNSNGSLS
jgi:hypothetical protein